MSWTVALITLLLVQSCVPPVAGYGEPDSSGHPNYQERANHVFMNAARIAPSQYKTVYMAGYSPDPSAIMGSTYPAVPPVYLEPKLVSSAYAHSADMATNGCFQHNSCDGTETFTRVKKYYTCSGTLGENIAAGNADPLDTSNQWLCDKTGSACAADGSGSDGHRSNIMGSGYKVVGTGYAPNPSSTYRHYWTQDFGGASCAPAPTSPVYGASHRVKSGQTSFIGVFYTKPATAPSTANVIVAGTSYPLSLDIGAPGAGTYKFVQTAGTGCRSYYFQFGSVRYPETGCLVTYGEGTCTTSFDPSCSGNGPVAAATTAVATTAAATTTVATTAAATTVAATTVAASTSAVVSTSAAATTAAASTAASVTTKVATTAAAATTATATTGTSGPYYLYTSSAQNGWTTIANSGVGVTHSFAYNGRGCLKAVLAATSGNNFVAFGRNPSVTNVWNNVQYYAASSPNCNILTYFNGGYYQSKALTSTWQSFSIPMSSLGNPNAGGAKFSPVGNPALIVQNSGTSPCTVYLSDLGFTM